MNETQMNETDAPMTDAEHATAYAAEAATLVDRMMRRGYQGNHEPSAAAAKLVDLIVQAAVLRVTPLTAMARACEGSGGGQS